MDDGEIDYQKVGVRMKPVIHASKNYLDDAIKEVSIRK
jgi:hypothetical protein